MRFKALLILFSAICLTAHADTIEVRGKITLLDGNMPPVVSLHEFTDEDGDVSAVVKDGSFTLKVPLKGPMQYNLRVINASYDIMLSPKEKESFISIKLGNNQLKNIQIDRSSENEAFKALSGINSLYEDKLRKQFMNCDDQENCQKELNELLSDYRDEIIGIQNKHKGTYTADVICKMKMPVVAKNVKNTAEEYRAGYFQNVPFDDENILSSLFYKDMIDSYVDYVMEFKYSKEDAFIKDLMNKAKADQKVFSKTATFLYDGLLRKSREKMMGMFIAWYADNKAAVNNPVLDIKVKNMGKAMPGQPFIDIVREDAAGKAKTLKEIVGKSTCTIVLFWSSECSHCREEMPYVKEMYEKYHDKGLNIYAVSLEQDKVKWDTFVKEKALPWTNVLNQPVGEDNPAMMYAVMFTPTIVMIDKNGVILHRFAPKAKLEKYIQEALR
jgi:thiol-disulfide isomerase/thioredoxin